MKKINDPVFEELRYNEKDGYWGKKIFLGIWGGDNYQLDLMIKCGKDEEITDIQRDAYNSYLTSLSTISKEVPYLILSYYKDHYEDIERGWDLDDELMIDTVDVHILLNLFELKKLFIDRNGNYGWLVEFIWDDYPISVVLSDEKVKIYEGWDVLKENYTKINDEAFGEMVYDSCWMKSVKMDFANMKGHWIEICAEADEREPINALQKKAYTEYLAKKDHFMEAIPNALIAYYLDNYDDIKESWERVPSKYNKKNISASSVMELVEFDSLYFCQDGRYGWLCKCPWEDEMELAFILSGDEIEVTVQDELIG